MSVLVSNIQRMCMHDGPGIRTTIFLKGCNLHCPWCANPENIAIEQQIFWDESKCKRSNGTCVYNSNCPATCMNFQVANCNVADSKNICPLGALGVYGKDWEADKLYEETLKDRLYWGDEGGITFSGGEPLLHIYQLQELMDMYRRSGISMAMETSLFAGEEALRLAMDYVSFFYVDVKVLEEESCKSVLGGDVNRYLYNVELLMSVRDKKQIVFRIPCSTQYVLTEENMQKIRQLLNKYRNCSVELLHIHHMAEHKYRSLQKNMYQYDENADKVNDFYLTLKQDGFDAKCLKV